MLPCLISAGATRNPVDAIRYLSAHASGRTGVSICQHLAERSVPVHFLGSPEAVLRASHVRAQQEVYGSTRDLFQRMKVWVDAHPDGGVVHSAAVGDYEAVANAGKISSGQQELTLTLRPSPKILDAIRGWGLTGPLVSFKAAAPGTTDDELVAIARAQLRRTGSDRVFANVIGRTGEGVFLVGEQEAERHALRSDAITALQEWLYDRLA
jgi:phosphopantothenoylcysteine synthetase/decarboxylase